MIVAPATCNTIAKWAAGISDTLPLGLIVEAVGKGLPTVAMPFSNRAQLSFPAVTEALAKLDRWGVTVLVGDDVYRPHEPRYRQRLRSPLPVASCTRCCRSTVCHDRVIRCGHLLVEHVHQSVRIAPRHRDTSSNRSYGTPISVCGADQRRSRMGFPFGTAPGTPARRNDGAGHIAFRAAHATALGGRPRDQRSRRRSQPRHRRWRSRRHPGPRRDLRELLRVTQPISESTRSSPASWQPR